MQLSRCFILPLRLRQSVASALLVSAPAAITPQTQCHYVEPHVLSPRFSTDLLGGWSVCDEAASSRRTPWHGRSLR